MDRAPLIHASSIGVPKPVHCNDIDISETSVVSRPINEITDMSSSLAHIEVYIVFRRLFEDHGAHMSSYEYVRSIDREIQDVVSRFPWYFQVNNEANIRHTSTLDIIVWQHQLLHIGVCLQRIRLNRPFLHARIGESWMVCAKAAQEMLVPYRRMRQMNITGILGSPRFLVLTYQVYTAAVAIAAFLLVERSLPGFPAASMIRDIEMVISDLEQTDLKPTLADGVGVLRKMLNLFEQNSRSQDPRERASLVNEIASVFGGEQLAGKYLKPYSNVSESLAATSLSYGVEDAPGHDNYSQDINTVEDHCLVTNIPSFSIEDPTSVDFEVALDMLSFDQWFDYSIPDENEVL